MAGSSPEEIKKSEKKIILIGLVLFVCTVLTVAVAVVPQLDVGGHGFDVYDLIVGLAIASVKAGLVALIFMHLSSEKKMIYWLFGSGIFFGIALIGITGWAYADPIHFDGFYQGITNWIAN